jgi:hypothetical protein
MSFGVGAFPFGLFQTGFPTNNTDHNYTQRIYFKNKKIIIFVFCHFLAPERHQNELLSRVFLGIALAVIIFIILN